MEIEVTDDVRNHKHNDDYPCLIIHFDENEDPIDVICYEDPYMIEDINWMPRFSELEKIIRELCKLDDEFKARVREIVEELSPEVPTLEVKE